MLQIHPIPAFKDNYIWVLIHDKHAIIIDPGDAEPVLSYLQQSQLHLSAIFITHHHWDHSGGITEVVAKYPAPVYGPAQETIAGVSKPVAEGDVIALPDFAIDFRVIDIPGHTLGHIAYYGHGQVFCGDTLFTAGCGRLFEGKAEQLYQSLQKLAALPDSTQIYCGHEYTLANLQFAAVVEPENKNIQNRLIISQALRAEGLPTVPAAIAQEKLTNPFLRCDVPAVKAAAIAYSGMQLDNPVEVFRQLRLWKDGFKW